MAFSKSSNFLSLMHVCKGIPKIELHAHLNGSIRDSTLLQLTKQKISSNELDPSYLDEVIRLNQFERSFEEGFKLFDLIHRVTDNLEAISQITRETLEDFAEDGCIYLELRTTPRQEKKMSKREYIETVLREMQLFIDRDHRMKVGLIISINRAYSIEEGWENINLAKEFKETHGNLIVGIDFSGNPYKGDVKDFCAMLEHAKANGLHLTIHFAEVLNEEEGLILLQLKPDRIGHAVFLTEKLKTTIIHNRIPIEICLTSNIKTNSVKSYEDHHFNEFHKLNHPVIICTDDQGIFQTSLSKEYAFAQYIGGLTKNDMINITIGAVSHIFATETTMMELRHTIEKSLHAKTYQVST